MFRAVRFYIFSRYSFYPVPTLRLADVVDHVHLRLFTATAIQIPVED
jgi:hypothetical protein